MRRREAELDPVARMARSGPVAESRVGWSHRSVPDARGGVLIDVDDRPVDRPPDTGPMTSAIETRGLLDRRRPPATSSRCSTTAGQMETVVPATSKVAG